jgi:hypothetical protein
MQNVVTLQTLTISNANPLSTQLERITGDSYSVFDYDHDSDLEMIRHKKTGMLFKIEVDRTPVKPVQEQKPDIYEKFKQFAIDLRRNDRQWREINAASYGEMLDCLPPLAMSSLGFLSSEPYTHLDSGEGVYISCIEAGSKFFAAYLTHKEFRSASIAGIPKREE